MPLLSPPLSVLYQDETMVIVYKPAGMLVHRSALAAHDVCFLMTELRNQLNRWVYPVHRLDRPTEGVMVFALSPAHAATLCSAFAEQRIEKRYLAVVRGHPPTTLHIDRALQEEDGKRPKAACPAMPAQTDIRCLATITLDVALDRYPTSRYALVEARPLTGRRHQIRRHLSGVSHPIIGDAKHGKGIHNRYFRHTFFSDWRSDARLLLAATALTIPHPENGRLLSVSAKLSDDFASVLNQFGWQSHLPTSCVTWRKTA